MTVNSQLNKAWEATGGQRPFFNDVHSKVIMSAAARRNVDIEIINDKAFVLRHGDRSVFFMLYMISLTSAASRYIAADKATAKVFLEKAGVSTPEGGIFPIHAFDDALGFAKSLGFPVVVKPTSGSGGVGVVSNIMDAEHFEFAWTKNPVRSSQFIIEKHIAGDDHRMFVVNGQFICAARRIPVNITGDGESTVSALIEQKNQSRATNPYVGSKRVKLTAEMLRNLSKHGLDEQSVIPAGRNIQLHSVANVGAGGDSEDVTEIVHPSFREIAEKATHAIPECFLAGVDLLVPDISKPANEQTYAVCEVNLRPDIAMHHFPMIGSARDAAGALVEAVFPGAKVVSPSDMKKVELTLSGKVIGVGLRNRIRSLASLNHVFGWARNEETTVRAVLCGASKAVDRVALTLAARRSTAISIKPWLGDIPDRFEILS